MLWAFGTYRLRSTDVQESGGQWHIYITRIELPSAPVDPARADEVHLHGAHAVRARAHRRVERPRDESHSDSEPDAEVGEPRRRASRTAPGRSTRGRASTSASHARAATRPASTSSCCARPMAMTSDSRPPSSSGATTPSSIVGPSAFRRTRRTRTRAKRSRRTRTRGPHVDRGGGRRHRAAVHPAVGVPEDAGGRAGPHLGSGRVLRQLDGRFHRPGRRRDAIIAFTVGILVRVGAAAPGRAEGARLLDAPSRRRRRVPRPRASRNRPRAASCSRCTCSSATSSGSATAPWTPCAARARRRRCRVQ